MEKHDLPAQPVNSIVLAEGKNYYSHSTAVLRILRKLSGLWPLMYILILVPPLIRDRLYLWVARRRYQWFGRRETCPVPPAEIRHRFLD